MAIYNTAVQFQVKKSQNRNTRRTSNPGEVEEVSFECRSRLDTLDGESLGLSIPSRGIKDDSLWFDDLEGLME